MKKRRKPTMTTESTRPLKLFYCYAREDKALRDELDIHLNSLKRQNLVTSWYDGAIGPGTEWEKEIDTQLRNADIILLLVTPHFMASDYCYDIEMKRALERHRRGTVRIIPIILRRTFLNDAPFRSLQILPTDAKPVTQWPDRDEAYWDITSGIYRAISDLHLLKTKPDGFNEGHALDDISALPTAFQEAVQMLDLPHGMYPDRQAAIHQLLLQLIEENTQLVQDVCDQEVIRFGVKDWDVPVLKAGVKWPPSGRILLFSVGNNKTKKAEPILKLQLGLCWGPEGTDTREKLFRMALSNEPPFTPDHYRNLPLRWIRLYRRTLLTPQSYTKVSDVALAAEVRKEWMLFMEHDLPKLHAVLKSQQWI